MIGFYGHNTQGSQGKESFSFTCRSFLGQCKGLFLFVVVSLKEGKGIIANVAVPILALGSLNDIVIDASPLYYQRCQPDVQLHQDGRGHKLESVEGLKAKGMVNALTRIGPDLVPLWTNLI
jgi:hypothetical protein